MPRDMVESAIGGRLDLPGCEPTDEDPGLYFDWEGDLVTGVVVDLRPNVLKYPPLSQSFGRFVASPAARALRRVDIRRVEEGTHGHYLPTLAAAAPSELRELSLTVEDARSLGVAVLPALERLSLRDTRLLAAMDLPRLRELTIVSARFSGSAMRSLAQSRLPELRVLRITLGSFDDLKPKQRPDVDDLVGVFAAFPGLTTIELHDLPFGDDLVAAELPRPDAQTWILDASLAARLRASTSPIAEKVVAARPTAASVARHLVAMNAEHAATGREQREAVRLRRWANLWLPEEARAIEGHASVPALERLAWALGIEEDRAAKIPLEQSFESFAQTARLRADEEIASAVSVLEDRLWTEWTAFRDVSALRDELRVLRWVLGVASEWKRVPTHVARVDLAPVASSDRSLAARVGRAWSSVKRVHREPLPRPLSEERVDEVEREIGRRFPPDLRLSYLRHGGGSYPAIEWLSLDGAIALWRDMDRWTDWSDPTKAGQWRREWFPFTTAELDSDFYGVDLEDGHAFHWTHELPGREGVLHDDFVEWLEWAGGPDSSFAPSADE
jgi:hypothetical protein